MIYEIIQSMTVEQLKELFKFTDGLVQSEVVFDFRGVIIDELEKKLSSEDFEKWLDTDE